MTEPATHGRGRSLPGSYVALDAACVALFVAIGRNNHDQDPGIGATLLTAAPFLLALAVAWLVVPGARRAPTSLTAGLGIWGVTVAGGLVLRRTVFDRGTAVAFVIVAALVLAALMLGWRAAATHLRRTRREPLRS